MTARIAPASAIAPTGPIAPIAPTAPIAPEATARSARRILAAGALALLFDAYALGSSPPVVRMATPSPGSAAAAAAPRAMEVSRSGTIETLVARLPGRLLAATAARIAPGRYGLALLVAGEPGPHAAEGVAADPADARADDSDAAGEPAGEPSAHPGARAASSIFFLEPGRPTLELLAAEVPKQVNAIAALAAADGRADQLIVGEPGILYARDAEPGAGAARGWHQILAEPGLDLRSVRTERPDAPRPRLPWVAVARAGKLELLAGDGSSSALRELHPIASFPLPLTAKREPWGIQLTSSPVQLLAAPAASATSAAPATPAAAGAPAAPVPPPAPLFAVGPEAQGKRRLRTLLLPATAGAPPVEAWSMLPADGQDSDSSYLTWSGRPALVVSSVPKFGIFVKRDLQLFLLARDRSRGGAPPAFAVHTECSIWHDIGTYFAGAGGAGRNDLVVIYSEGMRGKKLRFLVYADIGQGRLAIQPRITAVDVAAERWFYGADLTGDGVPDLLVRSQGRLLLFPGNAKTASIADRPTWSFTLPAPPPQPPDKRGVHVTRDDDEHREEEDERLRRSAATRLAGLADLRGDGQATLFLSMAADLWHTTIVAVGRAADLSR